jgi:hypothetical protein
VKWGHDELANDLAEHLGKNTDRIIWTDMQLGPAGSPRPDVFSIPKSYSNFKPLAYECKISVSDFRSDITKGKWQSYLKYASGVIFAVPQGLITKDDIPKGCGLIVRSENGWRMAKGPTLIPIANDLPKDFWIKLVIDGVNRSQRAQAYTHGIEIRTGRAISKKYGDDLAMALSRRDQAQRKLDFRTEELQKQIGATDIIHHAERQQKILETERQDLEKLQHGLCECLGLPAGSNTWDIRQALDLQKQMLSKDGQVKRCQQALKRALRDLTSEVKNFQQLVEMTEVDPQ